MTYFTILNVSLRKLLRMEINPDLMNMIQLMIIIFLIPFFNPLKMLMNTNGQSQASEKQNDQIVANH